MKKAFIIGNGKSRSEFDLSLLKDKGVMFGCNALYRDYYHQHNLPDYLIAIDEKIITEIEHSDFPSKRFLEPPEDEKWEPVELHWGRAVNDDWNPARPRSNTGINAILEAEKLGHKDMWLFGMDFLVVQSTIATSNIYDGTNGYEPETRASLEDTRNRLQYLGWILENKPELNFIFCYPETVIASGIYKPESPNCCITSFKDLSL
tara:strand:- start:849 stop:1463 length:615 start_codon:yes stop_codon:yes gene_type:complete